MSVHIEESLLALQAHSGLLMDEFHCLVTDWVREEGFVCSGIFACGYPVSAILRTKGIGNARPPMKSPFSVT